MGMEGWCRTPRPSAVTAWALLLTLVATLAAAFGVPKVASASAPFVTENLSFRASDGTELHAEVGGTGSLTARPVIVEDSPYAPAVSTLAWVGSAFNVVELQWRGTGVSGGSLDAAGPEDQSDLSQFLGWACGQPWSNGRLGLYGFSASAIVVYNALHLPLPCVKAAALMAGTTDLYRDLLDIGGIPNITAGVYVEAAIGGETLLDGLARAKQQPSSVPATALGYAAAGAQVLSNPTEDAFWQQRNFQGDLDHIPILADTSFYDVEPDGPFAAFNATKAFGSHLLVYGAHDGSPAGLPGPFPQYENWFDHYLLGQPLSSANQPVVSAYLSNGSRAQFLDGNVTHLTGSSWPLAGTQWTTLYLSSTRSAAVPSVNDGTLAAVPQIRARQIYPFLPSEVTETDLHNTSVLDGELDQLGQTVPELNDMALSAPTSLTYTSAPLGSSFTMVGPGALDIDLASSAPYTDIYAVVADVEPDGTAYPIATGALRTTYPSLLSGCSLTDAQGEVVDPCNDYAQSSLALPGVARSYQVELMPMGNVFAPGSRIRLYILGTPLDQLGAPPGLNTVVLGGEHGSRLVLPGLGDLEF